MQPKRSDMTSSPAFLHDLLAAMRPQEQAKHVSVQDVVARIGDRSFAPVILVVGLILVSPVSGIPGTPTIGSLIVILCAVQAILGRDHLWLPAFLMRRKVKAGRMNRGLDWLARPAAWIDKHTHDRVLVLSAPPMSLFAFAVITAIALTWPFLELLPFVTSFGAGAVSLIAFGLLTRDGYYLIWGYVVTGLLALAVTIVASGLL